jgi:hypothetical protein
VDPICGDEGEPKGSPGLSIATNPTAFIRSVTGLSPAERQRLLEKELEKVERKRRPQLTPEEYYWWSRDEEERVRQQRERFEREQGFPREWLEWQIHDARYRKQGELEHFAEIGPRIIRLRSRGFTPPKKRGERKAIDHYSWKSRKKYYEKLLFIDWDSVDKERILIGTLTYPGRFPASGIVAKKHLDTFFKRLKRHCLGIGGVALSWKMEFQRRGAPHFHLLLVTGKSVDLSGMRRWWDDNWSSIVLEWLVSLEGMGADEALEMYAKSHAAGIQLAGIRETTGQAIGYMAMYVGCVGKTGKEYQHKVPDGFTEVGRWWGFKGDVRRLMPESREEMPLTREGFDGVYSRIGKYWEDNGLKEYSSPWHCRSGYFFDTRVTTDVLRPAVHGCAQTALSATDSM